MTNIANIALCGNTRDSPFYIACLNGHDSTVQLIPKNGAYIVICEKDKVCPLYISGNYGHEIFRRRGYKLCTAERRSPLTIAIYKNLAYIVQRLIKYSADVYFP